MATWFDTASLDLLLDDIKTNADEVWLVDAYTQGDNWATVSGNKLAGIALAGAGADFTGPTASGNNRTMTFDGKTGAVATAASSAQQLHIVLVDTGGTRVLAVTDETSNNPISINNVIDFPSFALTQNQPSQV